MDYTLINIKQKGYVAVVVNFDGNSRKYTYKAEESDGIITGDSVVVFAQGRYAIATVVEVHDDPVSHLDPSIDYRWIVQVVDDTKRKEREEAQAEMVRTLKSFQAKRRVLEAAKAQEEILLASGISRDEITALEALGAPKNLIHVSG